MRTQYNKGVCSIHLGQELNAAVEAECKALRLSKSKVARFLFKRWLANNSTNRTRTGGAPLVLSGKWG